jgi:hypothetical protein
MSNTPNTGIPYVPESTLDPAAGLNLSLNVIDALLQTAVLELGRNAPPGSPDDGDLYIVGVGSGAWTGKDDHLARYVDDGDFWQFYEPGTNVWLVLNRDDGGLYAWVGGTLGWVPAVPGSLNLSYDVGLFVADFPLDAELVLRHIVTQAFTVPAGATGSFASATAASTGTVQFDLKKNGSSFGNIEFAASATGVYTVASPTSFVAGDLLTIEAPSPQDATLADVSISISGVR